MMRYSRQSKELDEDNCQQRGLYALSAWQTLLAHQNPPVYIFFFHIIAHDECLWHSGVDIFKRRTRIWYVPNSHCRAVFATAWWK
jgi:hypothetical protein